MSSRVHGRRRHAGRHLAGDRPGQERQLDLAERPPLQHRPRRRARPAGARRQRRRLLRAVGSRRRRRGRRGDRVRRDHRHRHRRRRRRAPAPGVGPERDRRRVGPQPAAVAARRGTARPGLLLRPDRLHRDVPVGAGRGQGIRRRGRPGGRRAAARRGGHRGDGGGRRRAGRSDDASATRIGWRAASPRSSTCSIRTSSCSAAACRTWRASTPTCRPAGRPGCSAIASTRGWCRRSTAIRAACAARRGCGRRRKRRTPSDRPGR